MSAFVRLPILLLLLPFGSAISSPALPAHAKANPGDGPVALAAPVPEGAFQLAAAAIPAAAASSSSSSEGGSASADDTKSYSGWGGPDIVHRLTFEAGAGASAPAGDKASITWGPGFLVGGGVNFNQRLATFLEYQFLDNKIPGSIISQSGATGGHYHIWSITLDPVFDLFPMATNDVYVAGGGGFYRKTSAFTELTQQQFCSYFYYCGTGYAPQTVGQISSSQGGFNFGGGYQHRFRGLYGEGHTRFFAEVRFVDVLSPALRGASPSGGLNPVTVPAGTKLLPITLGVRW